MLISVYSNGDGANVLKNPNHDHTLPYTYKRLQHYHLSVVSWKPKNAINFLAPRTLVAFVLILKITRHFRFLFFFSSLYLRSLSPLSVSRNFKRLLIILIGVLNLDLFWLRPTLRFLIKNSNPANCMESSNLTKPMTLSFS